MRRLLVDRIGSACSEQSRPLLVGRLAECPDCQLRFSKRKRSYTLTELFEERLEVLGGGYDCSCH